MPSRRRFLGLVATGILAGMAGCIEPGGALMMTRVSSDRAIGEAATTAIDPGDRPDVAALLEEAHEQGHADVDGERPPFDPVRPVRWSGAVHDVHREVVDERVRLSYMLRVEPAPEDATGRSIEYDELPSIDRQRIGDVVDRIERLEEREDENEGESDGEGDETGPEERIVLRARYAGDDVDASVLVPADDYDLVVVGDRTLAIERETRETTVSTYRYELEERAPSPAAYGTELREERLVVLEGLSDDERELVAEAIGDGSAVVGIGDDAFVAVGERLLDHEPIYIHDHVGEYLVAYEGETYWTELDALRTTTLVDRLEDWEEGADGPRMGDSGSEAEVEDED